MAHVLTTNIGIALWSLIALNPVLAYEMPASEKQKVEALLKHVEGIQGAKFVRNGQEHDAKTAAKFLRSKWEANAAEIKTAKEFIEKAASISSTTGKPYLIRLKDGTVMKSGDYLLGELKKLEKTRSGNLDQR